jgi:murein DD-endopeptidase MepM/ murein hydrolase activator NlpD
MLGALLLLLQPSVATPAEPVNINCLADLLCVTVFKDSEVKLVLENKTHKPLSFALFLQPDNLKRFNPDTLRLNQPMTKNLVLFPRPTDAWSYQYRIHYGHEHHEHDDDYLYTLPYARGSTYPVTQSHVNISTHHRGNLYAIDWEMPRGAAVHAARDGVVVSTYQLSADSSLTGEATANHIWIQHADGTIGKYLHLDTAGVQVAEGQSIHAGERIGGAGNTGFSSGSHLHFSVSSLGGENLYQTFNVKFKTRSGPRFLVSGREYAHP